MCVDCDIDRAVHEWGYEAPPKDKHDELLRRCPGVGVPSVPGGFVTGDVVSLQVYRIGNDPKIVVFPTRSLKLLAFQAPHARSI